MTHWFDVDVIHRTEKAVLVEFELERIWIPLSAIIDQEDDIEPGCSARIEISDSIATEKGIQNTIRLSQIMQSDRMIRTPSNMGTGKWR